MTSEQTPRLNADEENTMTDTRTTAVEQLRRVHQARVNLEAEELAAVAAARQAGAEWTEIGEAIGMRRQHASRKYRPLLVEQRTVRPRA